MQELVSQLRLLRGCQERRRQRRLELEQAKEAKRVSDNIDKVLRHEGGNLMAGRSRDFKVVVLGIPGAGKSTMMKQFQMLLDPASLEGKKTVMRAAVYYNVMRAIRRIDDTLSSSELAAHGSPDHPSVPFAVRVTAEDPDTAPVGCTDATDGSPDDATARIRLLHLLDELQPLLDLEDTLSVWLSRGSHIFSESTSCRTSELRSNRQAQPSEVTLLSPEPDDTLKPKDMAKVKVADGHPRDDFAEDVAHALCAWGEKIRELYVHPELQRLQSDEGFLEDSDLFFLDNIFRISETEYTPTEEDILHARLPKFGIKELALKLKLPEQPGQTCTVIDCRLHDVSGVGGSRHRWMPFLDRSNLIIFVAPIGQFDEYCTVTTSAGDSVRKNRMELSFELFNQTCTNRLTSRIPVALCFNKTDLLKEKIARGIQVRDFVTSYEGPNEPDSVLAYFRGHYKRAFEASGDSHRRISAFYVTTLMDTPSTQLVISAIRDILLRSTLLTGCTCF